MMVNVKINTEMEIHQAFRIVTTQAMREDVRGEVIEDAGAGMTNVTMNILGYEDAILQCYPNGEFDCVYIVIYKNAEEHSIEINDLPDFLQREVFEAYCAELKRKLDVVKRYHS